MGAPEYGRTISSPESYGIEDTQLSPFIVRIIPNLRRGFDGVSDLESRADLIGYPTFVVSDDMGVIDGTGRKQDAFRIVQHDTYRSLRIERAEGQVYERAMTEHLLSDGTRVEVCTLMYGRGGLDGSQQIQIVLQQLESSRWDVVLGNIGGNALISGNNRRGGIFRDARVGRFRKFLSLVAV